MRSNRWTLIAGLSLLIPPVFGLLYGLLFANDITTTALYPVPGSVLLPGLLVGPVAAVVSMVVFFVWNPGLFGVVCLPVFWRDHVEHSPILQNSLALNSA